MHESVHIPPLAGRATDSCATNLVPVELGVSPVSVNLVEVGHQVGVTLYRLNRYHAVCLGMRGKIWSHNEHAELWVDA